MLLETRKFEFEGFLLDAQEKSLSRAGKSLSVTPKAFELLVVLLENHGHLLEKEALMKAVWADSFVEESNLTFTIGLLRKALGDSAASPRFIETIPKRGYRFIARVTPLEPVAEIDQNPAPFEMANSLPLRRNSTAPENRRPAAVVALAEWRGESLPKNTEKPAVSRSFYARRRNIPAAVAILLSLAGIITLVYYFFAPAKNVSRGMKSIAVLPLKPINTSVRDEIYEIGIADSLIHRLTSTNGWTVRPLSAIRRYADLEQDPLAAGREQQTDYVLASNYQLAGGKIRVTAQLFNVADGRLDATYQLEKDAGNVFAMQDAIADEIEKILLARFAGTENGSRAKRGTINEEAYRLYLQGMYLCDKRDLAAAQKAVEILEQAVRLDPDYALAWAGKAYAHRIIGNFGRRADAAREYRLSIEAIDRALSLDASLSEAYSALCDNKMYYEYDFAGAEAACRRAVELAPGSALAHQVYSRYLNSRGRADEAVREIKTAIDLDPTSFHNQRNLAISLYFARRYDEAVTQFERVIAMDENYASTYMWLLFALEMQADTEAEKYEWFIRSPALKSADEKKVRAFQTAFRTAGWKGVLRERLKNFENSGDAYFQGAAYHAQLGDRDRAFEFLEKSFQRRELWMANLQVDPRLDPLRDDARYHELVRRVESK